MSRTAPEPPPVGAWSANIQSFVSLLLLAHFGCVLLANLVLVDRSDLQLQVLDMFRPYSQEMNLDPVADPPPFTYMFAEPERSDVGYRIQWLAGDGEEVGATEWTSLSASADASLGAVAWRQQRVARAWSYFADADDIPALLALAAARRVVQQGGRPLRIRCQSRRIPHPEDFGPSGSPPLDTWETAYEARLVSAGNQLRVVRMYPDEQTALSRGGPNGQ